MRLGHSAPCMTSGVSGARSVGSQRGTLAPGGAWPPTILEEVDGTGFTGAAFFYPVR